jgi:hypothetical protein
MLMGNTCVHKTRAFNPEACGFVKGDGVSLGAKFYRRILALFRFFDNGVDECFANAFATIGLEYRHTADSATV